MTPTNNVTERLIAQAKLGDEAAFVSLIAQVGPRLRRAIDVELEAVQHDLDATQMWNEIQEEAGRRLSEFAGSTEDEFEAWATRLALRHIRQSVRGARGVSRLLLTHHRLRLPKLLKLRKSRRHQHSTHMQRSPLTIKRRRRTTQTRPSLPATMTPSHQTLWRLEFATHTPRSRISLRFRWHRRPQRSSASTRSSRRSPKAAWALSIRLANAN